MSPEPLSIETIRSITRAAGLDLTESMFDDLVESYRVYEPILAELPREFPYSAEPAHTFDPRSFMPKGDAA
jgi:hypothetical protein